jgi:hypothetical protein
MEFRRSLVMYKNRQVLIQGSGSTRPSGTFVQLLLARPAWRSAGHADQVKPNLEADFSIAQRQAAMDFGRASVALEGLKASPEGEAIQQQWVRGELSIQECIDALTR